MKVMISLPMDGHSNEDVRKRIQLLTEKFSKLHIDVVDSFITEEKECNHPNVYYLGRSIMQFLSDVDAVYFDNGWNNARGCRIENQICKEYGIKCLYPEFLNDIDLKDNFVISSGGNITINTPGILKSNDYPKVTYRSSVDDNSLIDASNNYDFRTEIR